MANPEHLAILKRGVAAWNAWYEGNPLPTPDLRGAELEGANLEGARLWGVKLESACLKEANLSRAILQAAHLQGATLENAVLLGTDLQAADLRRANLRGADLRGAKFGLLDLGAGTFSPLRAAIKFLAKKGHNRHAETDFTGATFGETLFGSIDLSQAKGLESARHSSPSLVAMACLVESRARLPQEFLDGCGVSEGEIDAARLLLRTFQSAFISYAHADADARFARRLYEGLRALGIRCWLDEKKLKPGDRILDGVDEAIRLHDRLLICCSEASLGSWWVKDEIRKAQERERKEERDIMIPLNLDGYLFEWEDGLASDLTSRLAADFTGWEQDKTKFEAQFEKVVEALRAGPSGQSPAT